jgi:hypothetical protein
MIKYVSKDQRQSGSAHIYFKAQSLNENPTPFRTWAKPAASRSKHASSSPPATTPPANRGQSTNHPHPSVNFIEATRTGTTKPAAVSKTAVRPGTTPNPHRYRPPSSSPWDCWAPGWGSPTWHPRRRSLRRCPPATFRRSISATRRPRAGSWWGLPVHGWLSTSLSSWVASPPLPCSWGPRPPNRRPSPRHRSPTPLRLLACTSARETRRTNLSGDPCAWPRLSRQYASKSNTASRSQHRESDPAPGSPWWP